MELVVVFPWVLATTTLCLPEMKSAARAWGREQAGSPREQETAPYVQRTRGTGRRQKKPPGTFVTERPGT